MDENWRKRYNEELMHLFRDLDTLICYNRPVNWIGHVVYVLLGISLASEV